MKIEDHLRNINESLGTIKFAVDKGIENHQRNIGFNCSLAAVEMLEVWRTDLNSCREHQNQSRANQCFCTYATYLRTLVQWLQPFYAARFRLIWMVGLGSDKARYVHYSITLPSYLILPFRVRIRIRKVS